MATKRYFSGVLVREGKPLKGNKDYGGGVWKLGTREQTSLRSSGIKRLKNCLEERIRSTDIVLG